MVEQQEIIQIIEYLKKLLKIIMYEGEFTFLDIKFIKKSKIDDTFVCLLSVLPNSFKKVLNVKNFERIPSVVFYKKMFNAIKGKFALNDKVYLVHYKDAEDSIRRLLGNIERDLEYIERHL